MAIFIFSTKFCTRKVTTLKVLIDRGVSLGTLLLGLKNLLSSYLKPKKLLKKVHVNVPLDQAFLESGYGLPGPGSGLPGPKSGLLGLA